MKIRLDHGLAYVEVTLTYRGRDIVLSDVVLDTGTPVEVPDEVFAPLREWFDDAQIVELTSAVAWENYRARFDHALGVEAEGFSEGAFCPVPVPRRPAAGA